MKCRYCNGDLGFEEANCPHCGRPNKHAQIHARDMEQYSNRYEQTENQVYEVTQRYSGMTARAVAIAILSMVLILLIVVNVYSYEISQVTGGMLNVANTGNHKKVLESYLTDSDYLSIRYYNLKNDFEIDEYAYIVGSTETYKNIYLEVMEIKCKAAQEPTEEIDVAELVGYLDLFYRRMSYDISDRNEATKKHIPAMIRDVEGFLITYCNVPADRVGELEDMSTEERYLFLQECVNNDEL